MTEPSIQNQHRIPRLAVAVIAANLLLCMVVIPYLIMRRERITYLAPNLLMAAALIPLIIGCLYLIYRAFWWGMAIVTGVGAAFITGLYLIMIINNIPLGDVVSRVFGM